MSTADFDIIRYTNGRTEHLRDTVVREDWLDLFVNGTKLLQTPVSGREVEELIYGYLYAEGYLHRGERLTFSRRDDAWYTRVEREVKAVTMKELVDCAASKIEFEEEIEPLPAGPRIPAPAILALAAAFQRLPSLYHTTGGVHMAAFADIAAARASFDPNHGTNHDPHDSDQAPHGTDHDTEAKRSGILHSADDISRRNAVDKVIGKVFLDSRSGGDFSGGLLLISGRISSDIVVRMQRTGVPLIVSKSAPTEKAVRIAGAYGITLCGFARGRRVNIYTHSERVELNE